MRAACVGVCVCALVAAMSVATLLANRLLPEVGMYVSSTCADRTRVWDGKGVPRYVRTTLDQAPHPPPNGRGDGGDVDSGGGSPLVLIGTHHKTGTYLAKKVFSAVCARLQMCCVFLVTNDDEAKLVDTATNAGADIIAHWQWLWYPEQVAALTGRDYRFVHLYRDPLRKIASGFRYHLDGVEGWSQHFNRWPGVCSNDTATRCDGAHLCSACCTRVHGLFGNAASGVHPSLRHRSRPALPTDAQLREGHEFMCAQLGSLGKEPLQHALDRLQSAPGRRWLWDGVDYFGKAWGWEGEDVERRQRERRRRRLREVGAGPQPARHPRPQLPPRGPGATQRRLQERTGEAAVLVEAAVDYYESLTMAMVLNHTWEDPRTLNMDLDVFMHNFDGAARKMLRFLDLDHSPEMIEALVQEVGFFDLENSPIYRTFMTNPLYNHVNSGAHNALDAYFLAETSPALLSAYAPILQLTQGARARDAAILATPIP